MHEEYIDSMGLNSGLRIGLFDSIEELDNAAGKTGATLAFANQTLGEKDGLVAGRKAFSKTLNERTSFPFVMGTREKQDPNDKTKKITVEVRNETDKDYVDRFRDAILSGTFTHADFPADEAKLEAALQSLADSLGVFNVDPKAAVRVGKAKLPSKNALAGADNIIKNNAQEIWVKKFTKEKIAFENFQAVAADGATPEEVGAVAEKNRLALAWAIQHRMNAAATEYK